jgi:photosynthetic reaction center H subunit
MPTGAITSHIDVAQVVLYAFWIFFAGLIFYLRREDRREGYPLEYEATGHIDDPGPVWMPKPKAFLQKFGPTVYAPDPNARDTREVKAKPVAGWAGAPLEPTGDPMLDGVGPASWAERADEPEMNWDGHPKIVPMRAASEYTVAKSDVDPRGLPVAGADGAIAGMVSDIWVDTGEQMIRYLEVDVNVEGAEGRKVLVPMPLAKLSRWRQRIEVGAVNAEHFGRAPVIKGDDRITMLEEEKVCAFFAGGFLYANRDRMGPVL